MGRSERSGKRNLKLRALLHRRRRAPPGGGCRDSEALLLRPVRKRKLQLRRAEDPWRQHPFSCQKIPAKNSPHGGISKKIVLNSRSRACANGHRTLRTCTARGSAWWSTIAPRFRAIPRTKRRRREQQQQQSILRSVRRRVVVAKAPPSREERFWTPCTAPWGCGRSR